MNLLKIQKLAKKYPLNVSPNGRAIILRPDINSKLYQSQKEFTDQHNHHYEAYNRALKSNKKASYLYHRTLADYIANEHRVPSPEQKKLVFDYSKAVYED